MFGAEVSVSRLPPMAPVRVCRERLAAIALVVGGGAADP